jgi:hypothetical protein
MFNDICEIAGCSQKATHIGAPQSGIIDLCTDCYNKLYKS